MFGFLGKIFSSGDAFAEDRGYQAQEKQMPESQEAIDDVNHALLLDKYQGERELNLHSIRQFLHENDIDNAKSIIESLFKDYQSIATNDSDFIRLAKCAKIAEVYNKTFDENSFDTDQNKHEIRLKCCNEILSMDPRNPFFKKSKFEELEYIYKHLDEDNFEQRIGICSQITQLILDDENYKKEQKKYKKEKKKLKDKYKKFRDKQARDQHEYALAIQRKDKTRLKSNKPDYRIGNIVLNHPKLHGKYESSYNGGNSPIQYGKVSLSIHTHGISIYPAYVDTFDIHYSLIDSMEYATITSGLGGMLAGAAAGGLLGGIFGALSGAIGGALLGSTSGLRIRFRDPQTSHSKEIFITTKDQKTTSEFISRYHSEIEITKRTGRKPSMMRNVLLAMGKGMLILLGGLVVCIVVSFIVLSDKPSSTTSSSDIQTLTAKSHPEPVSPASPKESQQLQKWFSPNDSQCKITASSGTLTLSTDNQTRWIEVESSALYDGIDIVSVIFDRNKSFDIECTSLGSSRIRIDTDQSFIKKMRNGTTMKVIVHGDDQGDEKTLRFSLMGFSDVCKPIIMSK